MSSSKRPWYPWYPKDFIVDEKVQSLSFNAELLYRRALDVMWQANDQQLLNNCYRLANQIGKGLTQEQFESAWNEIQFPGSELFKTTDDGQWIYSIRLKKEAQNIENIKEKRQESGRVGGQKKQANTKQMLSNCLANATILPKQTYSHTHTHTDTDNIKESVEYNTKEKVCPAVSPIKAYQYPDWLNRSLWSDFCRMRSRIKKPITTERTINGLLSRLKEHVDKGYTQDEIIQAAIDHCWQSFFIPNNKPKNSGKEDWI